MDLPVKFPSETEVILEDVARFRALSIEERIQVIRGILADGAFLIDRSPLRAWILEHAAEEHREKHRSIQEFIARHAH